MKLSCSTFLLLLHLPATLSWAWTPPASPTMTAIVGIHQRRAALLFMSPNGADKKDEGNQFRPSFELKTDELAAGDIDEATFTADLMKQLEALEEHVDQLPSKRPDGLVETKKKEAAFSQQGDNKMTPISSSITGVNFQELIAKTRGVAKDSMDKLQTQLHTTKVRETGDTYEQALGKVGKAGQGIGKLLMSVCQDATNAVVERAKQVDLNEIQSEAAEKMNALRKESAKKINHPQSPEPPMASSSSSSTKDTPKNNPAATKNYDLNDISSKFHFDDAAEKLKAFGRDSVQYFKLYHHPSAMKTPTSTTTTTSNTEPTAAAVDDTVSPAVKKSPQKASVARRAPTFALHEMAERMKELQKTALPKQKPNMISTTEMDDIAEDEDLNDGVN